MPPGFTARRGRAGRGGQLAVSYEPPWAGSLGLFPSLESLLVVVQAAFRPCIGGTH